MARGLLAFAGLSVALALTLWGGYRLAAQQFCKPVVPQIAITVGDTGTARGIDDMLLMYVEDGALRRDGKPKSPRFSGCDIAARECIGGRARYEMRLDGERPQTIQIRGMGREGNVLLGNVSWQGPSYPDRVEIACDLGMESAERACRVTRIVHEANPGTSGRGGEAMSPGLRVHDQCSPV